MSHDEATPILRPPTSALDEPTEISTVPTSTAIQQSTIVMNWRIPLSPTGSHRHLLQRFERFSMIIENLDPGRNELRGRLNRFRDVLAADATFISLYQDAKDVYTATGDDQAGLKVHLTESLKSGLPTRHQTTQGTTQERSQLPTGEWVADALILFDRAFYDFWLFDRIDANDGWFVSRVKSDTSPEIVEELRSWPGNSITLEGKSLRVVLNEYEKFC